MIRPDDHERNPEGAKAAKHIRRWRARHTANRQEVQIIIAGEPWPSLYKGLGTYLRDSIRFENAQSMVRADLYQQLLDQATDAQESLHSADIAYESFLDTLELIEPSLVDEAKSLNQELESITDPRKPSWMARSLDEIAQQFNDGRTPSSTPNKKAA